MYRVRLTLWWSEKADWVMDGEEWGPMAGLCVGPSMKWSMEEAAGRDGGRRRAGGRQLDT